MLQWVKTQLDKIGSPALDWVQVEVTTHCNAACVYCPHTLLKNRWTNKHMPIELFHELIPFLKYTDLVYLQGWGEPLLHHDFFEMVRICKDRGKHVGLTTNGMLMGDGALRRLVDLELDIIGVSLAGTSPRTHNYFRKGTDFDKVVSCVERLDKIKAQKKTRLPEVHLAYLMLRSNFRELQEILPLVRKTGARQVIASNLTLIIDPKLAPEAIFNDAGQMDYYGKTLKEIKNRAADENIVFDYHGPGLDENCTHCRENVRHACVISVEGDVVPCVLTNPVLCENHELGEGQRPRYIFKGQSLPLRGMSFGNIRNETLTQIWNKKEYARFRDLFAPAIPRKPEQIRLEMPKSCVQCYKRLGA
jgi:MoaA/NifB/PqqE/SkfB family radical SAM enzyme